MALTLKVSALDDPAGRAFAYEFDADRTRILLGRRGGVDVLLPHARVSLVHARIERQGSAWYLEDERSTNGTRLNGLPLPVGQRRRLADGDRIGIGDFLLAVRLGEPRADAPDPSTSGSLARKMAFEVLARLGPGDAQPALHVLDGPQTGVVLTLGEAPGTFVLGRAAQGDLRLDDVDMWRERAALERTPDGVSVRELTPSAQLLVNGERVAGARPLREGDVLGFGGTSLRFHDPAERYLRELEAVPDDRPARERGARRARPRLGPEWLLASAGLLVALAAAVGLVWVLRG